MVISIIAFIYGIVAISKFGSKTTVYKKLIEKLKALESNKTSSSSSSDDDTSDSYNSRYNHYKIKQTENNKRRNDGNYNNYGNYHVTPVSNEVAIAILDAASISTINSLTNEDISGKSFGMVKSLKGIENGLGVVLFIFPIIFLVIEIVFLVLICGDKEYKVLPTTTFNILNAIKIICLTLSIIFIFLSLLYGVLLALAFYQFFFIIPYLDSCSIGIIVGMVYGYYLFWFYITLSVSFSKERDIFKKIGTVENPGPEAKIDANGNQIIRVVQPQVDQPTLYSNTQIMQNQTMQVSNTQRQLIQQIPQNPQNQNLNINTPALNINFIDSEYIVINGQTYRKDNTKKNDLIKSLNAPNEKNVEVNIQQAQPVQEPQNNEIKNNNV